MTIFNASYVHTLVDIGSYGSNNDSGVFRNSSMGKGFFKNLMNLLDPEIISNDRSRKELRSYIAENFSTTTVAFRDLSWKKISVFVWSFFSSFIFIMPNVSEYNIHYYRKKYSVEDAIFNCRLSRTRLVTENSFGILAA